MPDGGRTAPIESAALAAFLLPGLGGVVIGGAVALNSFFELGRDTRLNKTWERVGTPKK